MVRIDQRSGIEATAALDLYPAARGFFSQRDAVLGAFPECFGDEGDAAQTSEATERRRVLDRSRGPGAGGQWLACARELVEGDPSRTDAALDWALVDLLHAYRARLRTLARDQYHAELTVWATLAPHQKEPGKPPAIPEVLK